MSHMRGSLCVWPCCLVAWMLAVLLGCMDEAHEGCAFAVQFHLYMYMQRSSVVPVPYGSRSKSGRGVRPTLSFGLRFTFHTPCAGPEPPAGAALLRLPKVIKLPQRQCRLVPCLASPGTASLLHRDRICLSNLFLSTLIVTFPSSVFFSAPAFRVSPLIAYLSGPLVAYSVL